MIQGTPPVARSLMPVCTLSLIGGSLRRHVVVLITAALTSACFVGRAAADDPPADSRVASAKVAAADSASKAPQQRIQELIRQLGGEHTIILSTHILSEVEQICSRVLIIIRGKIVAEDSPARLIARLEGGERVRLQTVQAPADAVERLQSLSEVNRVSVVMSNIFEIECARGSDCRPALAQMVVEAGWGLVELRAIDASLEDIFLELTAEHSSVGLERSRRNN